MSSCSHTSERANALKTSKTHRSNDFQCVYMHIYTFKLIVYPHIHKQRSPQTQKALFIFISRETRLTLSHDVRVHTLHRANINLARNIIKSHNHAWTHAKTMFTRKLQREYLQPFFRFLRKQCDALNSIFSFFLGVAGWLGLALAGWAIFSFFFLFVCQKSKHKN